MTVSALAPDADLADAVAAAEDLARTFRERQAERLRSRMRVYAPAMNNASSIGDPCLRRLYYRRTQPDAARPVSIELQSIFDEGDLHEPAVIRLLHELGMRLLSEQRTRRAHGYQISGRAEGYIEWAAPSGRTRTILGEVKTVAPWLAPRLKTVEDLRRVGYTSRWVDQMVLYMLLEDLDRGDCKAGVAFVKDKGTGMITPIVVPLDLARAEALLDRAEIVNRAVAANEPPDFVGDPAECRRCAFFGTACAPVLDFGEGALVADEVLADHARVYHDTAEAARAHETAKKAIRAAIGERPLTVVGDSLITLKPIHKKAYTVAEHTEYRMTIDRLDGKET